ncbi:SDR family NAD(P)-dependent oxidoreductase, partial [Mycobacterium sp.]|uniref:SDR family NAD(P)-dependent oxidoreductase n=1 Tax=Mycobacterium sp. TaxID=1785 RepID=UPI003C74091B
MTAKTAVVTGGASGIGRAVAERLRRDGFRVAVIDLSPTNDDGVGHVADVTDRAQVDAAMAAIRAELGPILVLVNAAGVEGFKKFINMTFADWSRVIDVNLNGVFHTIQAVLP